MVLEPPHFGLSEERQLAGAAAEPAVAPTGRSGNGRAGETLLRSGTSNRPANLPDPEEVYTRGSFVRRFYDEIICHTMGGPSGRHIDAVGSLFGRPTADAGTTADGDGCVQLADAELDLLYCFDSVFIERDFHRSGPFGFRTFERHVHSQLHAGYNAGSKTGQQRRRERYR